jgi:hypothetical protein
MKNKKQIKVEVPEKVAGRQLPLYEPPQITTYTDEEILEEMGPAQAGSPCEIFGTC